MDLPQYNQANQKISQFQQKITRNAYTIKQKIPRGCDLQSGEKKSQYKLIMMLDLADKDFKVGTTNVFKIF